MRYIGVCVLSALWWLLTPAFAQDLTARQQEILRAAIATDGWLTESMHREFWSVVPPSIRSDRKAVDAIVSRANESAALALQFQKATWESLKLSLAERRVVKTSDYEVTKAEVLRAQSTPQERASAEKGARNADTMLSAAAMGRSMDGPNGPFYVTEEMVAAVLAGLDSAFHRLVKLSVPIWGNLVKEHSYPKEHVRILWDGPFARETQTIAIEGGKAIPLTLLTYRLTEGEHVAIGFMRLDGPWLDPNGAAIRTVATTLSGMGIRNAQPTAMRWRGRIAADGAGSTRTSTGAVHASVRIVEARDHGGAWQVMAISGASVPDAIALRERLEQASNFGSSVHNVASDPPAAGVFPEQFLVDCRFEPDRYSAIVTDPDAKFWHDDLSFKTRRFVLQMEPLSVVDPPADDYFRGKPTIEIRPQEFQVEWTIAIGKPIGRQPRSNITINRFSGSAVERFSMLETPVKPVPPNSLAMPGIPGPWKMYWTRFGQCEIHKKKL
jgi:hypothetical protein